MCIMMILCTILKEVKMPNVNAHIKIMLYTIYLPSNFGYQNLVTLTGGRTKRKKYDWVIGHFNF